MITENKVRINRLFYFSDGRLCHLRLSVVIDIVTVIVILEIKKLNNLKEEGALVEKNNPTKTLYLMVVYRTKQTKILNLMFQNHQRLGQNSAALQ
jgi:hypothetical protein